MSVYCVRFFRLPNQSKEMIKNTKHVIIKGQMIDIISEYVPKNSISIENKEFKNDDKKVIEKQIKKKIYKPKRSNYKKQFDIYKEFFDKCYK